MTSEAPPFWWDPPDWRARMLVPFSALYGFVASRRMNRAHRPRMSAPVLCVGNLTVGGSGKTPVAIALAICAREMGLKPGFLSRGYGGARSAAPHLVDRGHDSARHVGDEPLLLAEHAPVAVTYRRQAGARLLLDLGCDFLVMDDGFQSARIHFDYALLVVDAYRGIGNGHVIPAGPLRAPLIEQFRHADGLLKMGEGSAADVVVRAAARAGKPVFEAAVRPVAGLPLNGPVLAFAGIGHPQRFFAMLQRAGVTVERSRIFPDHHPYTARDMAELVEAARAAGCDLVTTAKDAVRLRHGSAGAQDLLSRLHVFEIETGFEIGSTPQRIIEHTLAAFEQRRQGEA